MSINKRVEVLIDKAAGSRSNFSQRTGISAVVISHIASGRNKVSLKAVEQILDAYPQVNAEWLITGKGAMFKDDQEQQWKVDLLRRIEQIEEDTVQHQSSVKSKIAEIRRLLDRSV